MDETQQQNGEEKSPIQLGEATLQTGQPKLAPRKAFGATGPRGSRYDHVLDKVPSLKVDEGYIEAKLVEGTDKDKAIGAIRVALKRRFGKEEASKLKVRALEGDAIGVFRVA